MLDISQGPAQDPPQALTCSDTQASSHLLLGNGHLPTPLLPAGQGPGAARQGGVWGPLPTTRLTAKAGGSSCPREGPARTATPLFCPPRRGAAAAFRAQVALRQWPLSPAAKARAG